MIVLRAGLLIDGTGSEPRHGVDIVLDGPNIREIRHSQQDRYDESGVTVLDHRDHVVLPGFIDLHVHLRNPLPMDVSKEDSYRYRVETDPELAVFYAAHAARATLASGFTALRSMGGPEYVALRRAIEADLVPGPRIQTSGLVIMTAGHTDRTLPLGVPRQARWAAWKRADGVDSVRARVRELVAAGVDFIKFDATGGLHAPNTRLYSRAEIEAIVEEGHNHGLAVAAHAHGKEGALRAIRAGVDTLEHGTFLDRECIEEMARHGVTYVPTLAIMNDVISRGEEWGAEPGRIAHYRELLETRSQVVRWAHDAGVAVALGTDSSGWLAPHGLNGVEFRLLHEAGLPTEDCIQAGTLRAATAMGLESRVGSVEVGKAADLVVLDRNPTDDLSVLEGPEHVVRVLKEGRTVATGEGLGTGVLWLERFERGMLQ